jgi:hypothetical protein
MFEEDEEEPTSQESVQSDQPVVLPERLLSIVKSLYDSVNSPEFTHTLSQVPSLELSEFSFHPLTTEDNEPLHLTSIKDRFDLTEKTRSALNRSYSLRCYNTFLAKRALVEKLMDVHTSQTESQVVYSLKDKLIISEKEINWYNLKKCCSRGKALFDFMDELNLGTFCKSSSQRRNLTLVVFMANLNWSHLYTMSVSDRTKIVSFIKADPDNHRLLIEKTRALIPRPLVVPQPPAVIPQPPTIVAQPLVTPQSTPQENAQIQRKQLGMRRI